MIPAPAYLILMLTDRCNLSCRYCYLGQNKQTARAGKDISFDLVDRAVFLWMSNPKKWRIQITGGEPFLARDVLEYTARKIRDISATAPVSVQTNATLLEDRDMDLIKRFNLEMGVSLDGDPAIQDSVRGRAADSFKGVKRLDKAGIPFNVTCVVSSANADRLHRLALALGGFSMAGGIGFDLLVHKGRVLDNHGENGIAQASPGELTAGVQKLKSAMKLVNAGRKKPLVLREMEKIKLARKGMRPSAFCHAASGKSMLVTPDGDLYPCSQTAYDPAFYLGSLNPERKASSVTAKRPAWPSLEERAKGNCKTCVLSACCPGECPSRLHYGNTGDSPLACTLYQALAGHADLINKSPGTSTQ